MADLPLLLTAKNGGALIGHKNHLYKFLPTTVVNSLLFWPRWDKGY